MNIFFSRGISESGAGLGLVVVRESSMEESMLPSPFLPEVWREGGSAAPCRGLILLHHRDTNAYPDQTTSTEHTKSSRDERNTNTNTTTWPPPHADDTFTEKFLAMSGLWLDPETRVLVVGVVEGSVDVPLTIHHAFRNSRHFLHIHAILSTTTHDGVMVVYRRCLYCEMGGSGLKLIYRGDFTRAALIGRDVFIERLSDLQGGLVRVVTMSYFPHVDYRRPQHFQLGGRVQPLDCLDFRMLQAIAHTLNFTYEVVEPPDEEWGVRDEEGQWTGIVGSLAREEGDFSMVLTPTPDRLTVMDHSRIYGEGAFVIVSLKPQAPTQQWAVIRALSGLLWGAVVATLVVWSVILWLLLKGWAYFSGAQSSEKWQNLSSSLFFGFGAFMQNIPFQPPSNLSTQMSVGWWWVFCIIITTAYRASLISQLTVPGKTRPINTYEDLLAQDGWTWSSEDTLRTMADIHFYLGSPSPVVKEVYRRMMFYSLDKALQEVLKGGHSFISWKNYIDVAVASRYSDSLGYTPFYIPSRRYPIFGGYSWCFRKGAPFLVPIRRVKQQLIESGLVSYWLEDVIKVRIRDTRTNSTYPHLIHSQDRGQTVLGLQHLQGAFYQLFLGYLLALLSLLAETVVACLFTQHITKRLPAIKS
ncbi:hypothetical protein Pmani_011141 [Petrolisthes manimaculis]|uniref:Ionotropic glutamate receptor L-glutamate and glycine-binding domain-containing protein n=1 Tax=Petrolisthes manimaculis TaxID=1843537 RepID=A0AAE1Q3J9_9EUCA|nr:hypothetical protein Pmani_011141 [Petrolisthes manimaculis]